MKKLTLKNIFFVSIDQRDLSLQSYLEGIMLHGQQSRSRTRFIRIILPRIKEIDEERMKIMGKYQIKDKKTKLPLLITRNNEETTDLAQGIRYKLTDKLKFDKELEDYLDEAYVVDVVPSNREDIYAVRDMLFQSNDVFNGRNAFMFDEWCKAFENISEDNEEKNEIDPKKQPVASKSKTTRR